MKNWFAFAFSLILVLAKGAGAFDEFQDQVVTDLLKEKDHVQRSQKFVTLAFASVPQGTTVNLYGDKPDPKFSEEVLKHLLGYYGLKKKPTPKPDHMRWRYDDQVVYALEYIIRAAQYGNLMGKIESVLSQMESEGKEINNQHVSWVVLFSQIAYHNAQLTFFKKPNDDVIRQHDVFGYVRSRDNYEGLKSFQNKIFSYITEKRVTTKADLDAQLEKVHYAECEGSIFRYLKILPSPTNSNTDGDFQKKKYGFYEVHLKPTERWSKFNYKVYPVHIHGKLVSPGGAGVSCFYYASYWATSGLDDSRDDTQENAQKARQYLVDKVESAIDDPVLKYWLTLLAYENPYPNFRIREDKSLKDIYQDRDTLKKYVRSTMGEMGIPYIYGTVEVLVGYLTGRHEVYLGRLENKKFWIARTLRLSPPRFAHINKLFYVATEGHRMYLDNVGVGISDPAP